MQIFRLSRAKYADDLTGKGSRLNGGRWNNELVACIYASETRALAVLEYTVNISIDDIPRALNMVTLEVRDENILTLQMSQLPGDWRQSPAPGSTKDFGSQLLLAQQYAVIKLPSCIIPDEYNYILNPLVIENLKLISSEDFVYDRRIKQI